MREQRTEGKGEARERAVMAWLTAALSLANCDWQVYFGRAARYQHTSIASCSVCNRKLNLTDEALLFIANFVWGCTFQLDNQHQSVGREQSAQLQRVATGLDAIQLDTGKAHLAGINLVILNSIPIKLPDPCRALCRVQRSEQATIRRLHRQY